MGGMMLLIMVERKMCAKEIFLLPSADSFLSSVCVDFSSLFVFFPLAMCHMIPYIRLRSLERERNKSENQTEEIIGSSLIGKRRAYSNLIKSSNKKRKASRYATFFLSLGCFDFSRLLFFRFILIKMDKANSNHKSTTLLCWRR